MSTRANIVLKFNLRDNPHTEEFTGFDNFDPNNMSERMLLDFDYNLDEFYYHHTDGYPEGLGDDLKSMPYWEVKERYEKTENIHGDIEYLYVFCGRWYCFKVYYPSFIKGINFLEDTQCFVNIENRDAIAKMDNFMEYRRR